MYNQKDNHKMTDSDMLYSVCTTSRQFPSTTNAFNLVDSFGRFICRFSSLARPSQSMHAHI